MKSKYASLLLIPICSLFMQSTSLEVHAAEQPKIEYMYASYTMSDYVFGKKAINDKKKWRFFSNDYRIHNGLLYDGQKKVNINGHIHTQKGTKFQIKKGYILVDLKKYTGEIEYKYEGSSKKYYMRLVKSKIVKVSTRPLYY